MNLVQGLRQAVVLMEILKANQIHSVVKLDKTFVL